LVVLLAAGLAISPSTADTGLIRAVVTKGGFIIGGGGGTGTLVFRGRHYPLQINGMSFGATIDASTADLRGHACHMQAPRPTSKAPIAPSVQVPCLLVAPVPLPTGDSVFDSQLAVFSGTAIIPVRVVKVEPISFRPHQTLPVSVLDTPRLGTVRSPGSPDLGWAAEC
jgi:hypothetical protein